MLNLQEALADDCFAVALVELSGRVGKKRSMVNGQCSCCVSRTAGSSSSGATTTTSRNEPSLVLKQASDRDPIDRHRLVVLSAFTGVDHFQGVGQITHS
jgi:hypothetical protein